MNSVNKTLFIPLHGKAYVSRRGLFLHDKKAEEIWAAEGFPLKGKAKSKWLAYYMGIRSTVFDDWLRRQMADMKDAAIIHIGCGMDSRVMRVGTMGHTWFDVDFPEVIRERRRYFQEGDVYHMIEGDVRDSTWLDSIPETRAAIIIMEGVSMYLKPKENIALFRALGSHFGEVRLLTDSYTALAARLSKYKNPINTVGVNTVYSLDDPNLPAGHGFGFLKEHDMTPERYIDMLPGLDKVIFRSLFAGKLSKKLYRLFEYRKS